MLIKITDASAFIDFFDSSSYSSSFYTTGHIKIASIIGEELQMG